MTFDVLQLSKQKTSLSSLHAVAADIMNSNSTATVDPGGSKIGMRTTRACVPITKDLNLDDHAQNLSAIKLKGDV